MQQHKFKRQASCLLIFLTAGWMSPAMAHVGLEWPVAFAGTDYKAIFKIGHGCGASPTRQVAVDIPAGVIRARPMPRPGWTVEIQRAPLPQARTDHGRLVTEDVVRVTWTARSRNDMLDAAHFDEFVVQVRLPQVAGPLYWPVRQLCQEGQHDWVQVPLAGQAWSDLRAPAAFLDVLPAGGASAHHPH